MPKNEKKNLLPCHMPLGQQGYGSENLRIPLNHGMGTFTRVEVGCTINILKILTKNILHSK